VATDGSTLVQTPTRRAVREAKRAQGIIVPLLEDLFREPVDIEDELDRKFLANLIKARSKPRHQNIYSPSSVATCIRKVYFQKTREVEPLASLNKSVHALFLDGNFRHFKLQFALWKLHRQKKIKLIGVEVFVLSQAGDWGGTFDALVEIDGELYIIDFKGANTANFMRFIGSGGGPLYYRVQISGYAMLASGTLGHGKISKALIIYENKNGKINGRKASPIGLYEEYVEVKDYRKRIVSRLEKLRYYERAKEIPPPECVTTTSAQFIECPFAAHCRGEVKAKEKKNRELARGNTDRSLSSVSRSTRVNRSRKRNSEGQRS
jgi:hypothetical protein